MSDEIGRIKRVNLRDVWKHEAQGLTKYLENNIDVVSELIDLELSNVEREKSIGDFSVDLTAEDQNHNLVVIENQLEQSDHDHLGKIVTYLSSLGAKIAIWIVAKPRAEHVKAVSWLNESGLANFYLLKIEAIQIEALPAPLLTLIAGPSEESRVVGETKKNISERHSLRRKWWTELLERARTKTKLHANISPSDDSWVGTGAGKSGLAYNYVVGKHNARIELYIDCGQDKQAENKRIFSQLYSNKKDIEAKYGGELTWQRMETNRASRIAKYLDHGGYRDDEDKWPKIQDEMIDNMINFSMALSPLIDKL